MEAKQRKKQIVSKSGECVTSKKVITQMQLEKETIEMEKNEKAKNKRDKEQKKLEKQQLTQVKRINKSKKQCHKCDTKQTLKNKSLWIGCFRCNSWCCYECLPQEYKGACVNTTFHCASCKPFSFNRDMSSFIEE